MARDYEPIACSLYSRYELAIMRRALLQLSWAGHNTTTRVEILQPVDLRTHRSAEYLIARSPSGVTRVLRLDRIRRVRVLDAGAQFS